MARQLSGTAGDRISFPALTLSGAFGFSIWARWDATPNTVVCGDNNTYGYLLFVDGTNFYVFDGDTIAAHGGISTGLWYHIAITRDTSHNVSVYKNGTLFTTGTSAAGPAFTALGGYDKASGTFSLNGALAEAVIWTGICPTADEVAALALGVNPGRIRPSTPPTFYLPLWGLQSPEPDLSGNGNSATLNGSITQANHAPVTTFTRKSRTPPDIASGGVTSRILLKRRRMAV